MAQKLTVNDRRAKVRAARRAFLHSKTSASQRILALSTLVHSLDDPSTQVSMIAARCLLVESDRGGRYERSWTDRQLEAQTARAEGMRKEKRPVSGAPSVTV